MVDAILNVSRFDNADLNLESAIAQDNFESGNEGGAGVWRFNSADDIIRTDPFNDPYDATAWESLFERTLEAGCDENGNSDIDNVEGELPVPTLRIHQSVK